jgi:hypothetical protein
VTSLSHYEKAETLRVARQLVSAEYAVVVIAFSIGIGQQHRSYVTGADLFVDGGQCRENWIISMSIFLWASHDMQMRVGRSGPHDVGSGRLVRGRKSGSFRIEGPHDHPVGTNLDGHARGVMGI